MKYDWKEFTAKSDGRYRETRQTGNMGGLAAHNILSSGDVELRFIADVVRSHGRHELPKGQALDVCCGSGYMSSLLAGQGYHVRGFDMSVDAVHLAGKNHPDIDFRVDDAACPSSAITADRYDFILIREAHPFSRICDDEFQSSLLRLYIALLKPNGVLAIGHARRGGGMSYPSISYADVKDVVSDAEAFMYGPYFMFAYKHLKLTSASKFTISMLSFLSNVVSRVVGSRWIEYVVIHCK